MRIRHILVALAATAVGAAAFALPPGEEPPPPPPPTLNDCSPGFWKNHTELWATQYCGSQMCVDNILADLTSRGKGSGDIRQAAADMLNAWADSEEGYGYLICTD